MTPDPIHLRVDLEVCRGQPQIRRQKLDDLFGGPEESARLSASKEQLEDIRLTMQGTAL